VAKLFSLKALPQRKSNQNTPQGLPWVEHNHAKASLLIIQRANVTIEHHIGPGEIQLLDLSGPFFLLSLKYKKGISNE